MNNINSYSYSLYEATSKLRIQPEDNYYQAAIKLPLEIGSRSIVMIAAMAEVVFFTSIGLAASPFYFLSPEKYLTLISRARDAAYTAFLSFKLSSEQKQAEKEVQSTEGIDASKRSWEPLKSIQTVLQNYPIFIGAALFAVAAAGAYYFSNDSEGVCPSNIESSEYPSFSYIPPSNYLKLPSSSSEAQAQEMTFDASAVALDQPSLLHSAKRQSAFTTNYALPSGDSEENFDDGTWLPIQEIVAKIRQQMKKFQSNVKQKYYYFTEDKFWGNRWKCETEINPIKTKKIEDLKRERTICQNIFGPHKGLVYDGIATLKPNVESYYPDKVKSMIYFPKPNPTKKDYAFWGFKIS